jgi:alginate O-acetyltransferase complex protein AlgI
MACGLALMFGVNIPQNFNSPFKAKNISDFWQRWHISLSLCFQRYLFNPLAMALRHHRSLWLKQILPFMLTMTLIGIWHGSGWTYIIWGALHGSFLSIAYLWKSSMLSRRIPLHPRCSWALTFFAVMLVFIWFRAENINAALLLSKGLFGAHGVILPALFDLGSDGWLRSSYYLLPSFHEHRTLEPLLAVCPAWLITAWLPNSQQLSQRFKMNKFYLFATSFLLFLCLIKINKVSVFLYYQF